MLSRRLMTYKPVTPAPPVGNDFSDDFNDGTLNQWTIDIGDWSNSNNRCVFGAAVRFQNGRIRYTDGQTSTDSQYAKVTLANNRFIEGAGSLGFILRGQASDNAHYQVHLRSATECAWERHNPDYVERMHPHFAVPAFAVFDIIGVVITGSNASTELRVWNFGQTDPDSGGTPDPDANWGAPDAMVTPSGETGYVNTGKYVGLRGYRGAIDPASSVFDDFFAGDYR